MNKLIIALIIIVLAGLGYYFLFPSQPVSNLFDTTKKTVVSTSTLPVKSPEAAEVKNLNETIIGKSVEGRPITAYHYGAGDTNLLFIGGIHGGYSWNTALVAYEMMDYLEANPSVVPAGIRVTVIPVLNPDGLNKVVGTAERFTSTEVPKDSSDTVAGRFNARNVDLNRNFDCDWKATGTWQNKTVSGGANAFSEPESQALRNYVQANKLSAVVTWYSAAGGVYASSCGGSISTATRTLMNAYATASGYAAYDDFDFYEITGDMVNWLAKNDIPAVSVLLTNHQDTEWGKNKKGLGALLKYHAQ